MADSAEVETDRTQNGVPQTLYKFRSWKEDKHRRLLTDNEIFFASPRHFNDPFDCRIPIDFLTGTKTQVKEYYMMVSKEQWPDLNRDQRKSKVMEHTNNHMEKRKDPEFVREFHDYYREQVFSSFGVLSLSRTCKNILLWSHYADGHQGYCVGFDTAQLRQLVNLKRHLWLKAAEKMFKVHYPEDNAFPKLLFFGVGPTMEEKMELLNKSLSVKSKVWEYEEEWRYIIMYATDKKVVLPEGVITTVILGASMPEKAQREIKQELAKRAKSVKLLKAETLKDSFGLEIIPVD
jgi:hypothetical protein